VTHQRGAQGRPLTAHSRLSSSLGEPVRSARAQRAQSRSVTC
jgi:hypothetical protein